MHILTLNGTSTKAWFSLIRYSQTSLSRPLLTRQTHLSRCQNPGWISSHAFYLIKSPPSPLARATTWTDLALCELTSITCHMAQLTALVVAGRQVTTLVQWVCELSCKTPAVVTLYQSAAVICPSFQVMGHPAAAWPGHTALVVIWQRLSLPSCLSAHTEIQLDSTCQPNTCNL